MRLLLVVLLSGCLSVVSRPMRTIEGPAATVAGGVQLSGARSQFCYESCTPQPITWPAIGNNDARYGAMLTDHIGVSGGGTVSLLGGRAGSLLGLLVGYGQVTLQNDHASLAAGSELGINVISPFVGGDVQPFGPGGWLPNLSIYGRYSRPFTGPDSYKGGISVVGVFATDAGSSRDGGVTLRSGPLFAQYAYFTLATGRIGFGVIEGSYEAASWHVLLVGVQLDRAVPWLRF